MSRDPKSSYYDEGGIETIAFIEAKLTHEQLVGYHLGLVLKYASRMSYKGTPHRDAEKMANHSAWLRDHMDTSEPAGPLDEVFYPTNVASPGPHVIHPPGSLTDPAPPLRPRR
jgi:hypothetical protein